MYVFILVGFWNMSLVVVFGVRYLRGLRFCRGQCDTQQCTVVRIAAGLWVVLSSRVLVGGKGFQCIDYVDWFIRRRLALLCRVLCAAARLVVAVVPLP